MRLILGSQSPRRKEILSYFTYPFIQIASGFDEESIPYRGDPQEYTMGLSSKKAEALAFRFPKDLILTADTVVYFQGKVYNKPSSREEGFEMLRALAGNWHQVFTGVTLQHGIRKEVSCEETRILFHPLTDEMIRLYHESCNCLDKAAGYAIQQGGGIIIARIEGCYTNVMGLPINTLNILMDKLGINLWKHLRPF
jgi:septum formation protein